jgi:hypothetical protein
MLACLYRASWCSLPAMMNNTACYYYYTQGPLLCRVAFFFLISSWFLVSRLQVVFILVSKRRDPRCNGRRRRVPPWSSTCAWPAHSLQLHSGILQIVMLAMSEQGYAWRSASCGWRKHHVAVTTHNTQHTGGMASTMLDGQVHVCKYYKKA